MCPDGPRGRLLLFDTIQGLPVHPLVIHAVVVLIPLCSVGIVVMAFSQRWRERLRLPVFILLFIGGLATLLAKLSGDQLQHRLSPRANPELRQQISHHASLGSQALVVVFVLCLVTTIWLFLDWRGRPAASPLMRVLAIASVVCAVAATGWVIWAGDAGARAVWQQTISSTSTG